MSSIVSTEHTKPKRVVPKDKQRQYQLTYQINHREKFLENKRLTNKKYREKDINKVKEQNRKAQNKYHRYKQEVLRLRNIDLF